MPASGLKLFLYCNTLRYLRFRQIVAQLYHLAQGWLDCLNKLPRRAAPYWPGTRGNTTGPALPFDAQRYRARDLLFGKFTFLNDTREIGWPPRWDQPKLPKLWQYNLHYFEYLWVLDYPNGRAVVLDWIAHHEMQMRLVGWEPYPVSLRLINWCGVFFGLWRVRTEADPEFRDRLWQSIYAQAQWLAEHIEYHLSGNHLFENAAALAYVGSCFRGGSARIWLEKGLELLRKEIPEQILPDGLHFERSPMYHLRLAYLLTLLAGADEERLRTLVEEPLDRMRKAVAKLCHPDGQIALLNDSAIGVYNPPHLLISEARQGPPPGVLHGTDAGRGRAGPWALPHAGYYGWRDCEGNYLVCDAGPIGPDYIPGHAHADIFSFELSFRGHRVIVDSGVHDYERSAIRKYCRSTRAHNTVEVEGEDQCEMWAAFRIARRGRPHDVKWRYGENGFSLEAWHDGYRRLRGSPQHRRRFEWRSHGQLIIRDLVSADRSVAIVSRLHLHPDCRMKSLEPDHILIAFPGGEFSVSFANYASFACEESLYCPEFGVAQPNLALALKSHGRRIEGHIRIELLATEG